MVIRVGLDSRPGYEAARFTTRLNGAECQPLEDLKRDGPFRADGDRGTHIVRTVAEVAPRVARFEAPLAAVRRGYNTVEISLKQGDEQRIIWLEIYVIP
jgi:hypothetical protein